MNWSKLIVALLFNAAVLVLSSRCQLHQENPSHGVLGSLMGLVTAGDDPDAIARAIEDCPMGFSRVSNQLLKEMIRLDRSESFCRLFGLLQKNGRIRSSYLSGLFWESFIAHRPKICKFLLSAYSEFFDCSDFKEFPHRLWIQEPSLPWTLAELIEVFPPGSRLAYCVRAPNDVFRECATLEACLRPFEFNVRVLTEPEGWGVDPFSSMLHALLNNRSLGDEDMVALIQQLLKRAIVDEETVDAFSNDHPNHALSLQALIAALPDDTLEGYPAHVLEGLCRLSYKQSVKLKEIIAEGDNVDAVGSVLGYSIFALGKCLYEVLRLMQELNLVESFKVLFSMVDFVHLPIEPMLALIFSSHVHENTEIFEYLLKSDQFAPGRLVQDTEASDRFEELVVADLTTFVDFMEHMAAVSDKVAGGILFSTTALKLMRNHRVGDHEMVALIGRLHVLGAVIDQEAVVALQKYHPGYVLTLKFLIEHLPNIKEPAE
jgi:hypothetical protein